jgi:hypothetical protein
MALVWEKYCNKCESKQIHTNDICHNCEFIQKHGSIKESIHKRLKLLAKQREQQEKIDLSKLPTFR